MYKEIESDSGVDRTVMGSFQTIPRRALVASRAPVDGQVQVDKIPSLPPLRAISSRPCSCLEEFRRQGLAANMLQLMKDDLAVYARRGRSRGHQVLTS